MNEQQLHEELSAALKALGPNPTREQLQATCAEVLTRHMPNPEVGECWMDPDGTLHFNIKWM
jgi:hypothetical protein